MVLSEEYEVRRWEPATFSARAMDFLLRDEAEHNLLIGIIGTLLSSNTAPVEPPYLVTIERAGEVIGCAFRTPPYKLGLTRMPLEAMPALARDAHTRFARLPAVIGREAEAVAFGTAWNSLTGSHMRPGRRSRIYQLEQVIPPQQVSGALRRAHAGDLDTVSTWIEGFGIEADHPAPDPRVAAVARIASGEVYLWVDEEPVCMAARVGRTPHGERIGLVYTPPAERGHGYASACAAALSQRILDEGRRFCYLYTDLGNPTSNAIYQRIGYRPVCDVVDYDFY